jgi:hypothetical protein
MGSDKMLPRHIYEKSITVRFPDRSEWRKGLGPTEKGDLSGIQMVPRPTKARELVCTATAPGESKFQPVAVHNSVPGRSIWH